MLTLVLLVAALLTACGGDVTLIGILEADQSTPMEETRDGFLQALRDGGYKGGDNARFLRRNADVRDQPLEELAQELLVDEKVALLLALSTEALAAALEGDSRTPIVFAMAGNPFAVQAKASPAAWARVTGAMAPAPDLETVALVLRLSPQRTRLGILFDPLSADSVLSAGRTLATARESGFVAAAIATDPTPLGVAAATQSLLDEGMQAIYVTPSALLEEEFSRIAARASDAGVPVLATKAKLTAKGALVAIEVDWEDHGRRAGDLARRVLEGANAAALPISREAAYTVTVNSKVAERLGISLPDDVLAGSRR